MPLILWSTCSSCLCCFCIHDFVGLFNIARTESANFALYYHVLPLYNLLHKMDYSDLRKQAVLSFYSGLFASHTVGTKQIKCIGPNIMFLGVYV